MDQIRTGKFISELRREKELTQAELAERISVSAKTVSKWECGRGMPEISTLPELCEVLGVSVNELLSGERLQDESYAEHAEENIVTLLKDSKTFNSRPSIPAVAVPVIVVAAGIIYILKTWGQGMYSRYIDLPPIFFMCIVTTVFLLAAGSYGDLWRAFIYASGFGNPAVSQLNNAINAVVLAGRTMLASSACITVIEIMNCLYDEAFIYDALENDDPTMLTMTIALSFVSLLYGIVAVLISLPIKTRLIRRKELM